MLGKDHRFGLIPLLFLFFGVIQAEAEGDGGYAGAFLRMGLGARPLGMGGAFSAVAQDAYAGYYNPSGLPLLNFREFVTTLSFLPLDRRLNYIGYAQSISPKTQGKRTAEVVRAGFSLGWINSGVENIDGRDMNGRPIGTFSNSENAFYFSFALMSHQRVSLGFSAKVLYNRFPSLAEDGKAITAKGFGMDFGALIRPFDNLSLGILMRDVGSKYTWNTEKLWERGTTRVDRFPRGFRVGVAFQLPEEGVIGALDLEKNQKQDWRYHLGFEVTSNDKMAFRGGLNNGEFSFGVGFKYRVFKKISKLDYAYVVNKVAARGDHFVSWSFLF